MRHGTANSMGAQALLLVLATACAVDPAHALPPDCPVFTSSTAQGWFTSRLVSGTGEPGDVVTVTFSNGTSQHITVGSLGRWALFPTAANAAGAATLSSTNCPKAQSITVASYLNPPGNHAIAAHTILPGSTASVAGNAVTLAGGYTVMATAIDYDSASSTYGDLSGVIVAGEFNVTGSNGTDSVSLGLGADQPYTVSMLSVFASSDPLGAFITFSIPISGLVTLNGVHGLFDGLLVGTSTYGADGFQTYDFLLALHSDFGDISGAVTSSGVARLVPEPKGLALFGLLALALFRFGRRGHGV